MKAKDIAIKKCLSWEDPFGSSVAHYVANKLCCINMMMVMMMMTTTIIIIIIIIICEIGGSDSGVAEIDVLCSDCLALKLTAPRSFETSVIIYLWIL
jgi:hypothetical protein